MAIFTKDQPQSRPVVGRIEPPAGTGVSVVGPKMIFEGKISGTENVVIDGVVKGSIDLDSDVRISSAARVEATVHARNVSIEGTLIGDVSADEKVDLVSTANVDGNIRAPKIVVAEGARFHGAVDMNQKAQNKGK